ncbi:MAG TPA: FAD-dependent oxidoreductase [Chitinophagaceae bacterium]|nr:FAD-dependent oxidoreductase [Chitinophagaceae bacterium]
MKRICLLIVFLFPFLSFAQRQVKATQTDVLVIGAGVGGTAAAIQSARLGAKTVLVEPTTMLGGMLTSAGVSCTDGNDQLPSGMWEEFRQALYKHYGRKRLNTGWVSNTNFEPKVGDSIFKAWAAKEKNLKVYYGYEFESVQKKGNKVIGATLRNKDNTEVLKIKAEVVIDGTELGDVFAAAGAGYDLGMDDPAVSGEKEAREKNDIIQDLTWAAVLKDYGAGADKTIAKPEGYNAKKFYCTCTDAPCEGKPWNGDKLKMLNYGKLPRSPAKQDKYMLNWPPFGNDIYLNVVEDSYEVRSKKYELAKQHTLGFIYFMQTELGMKNIGLADDELDGGMALIPYNREGRRVKGVVRMNINHIKNPYDFTLYRTGIAVGDYPVDHHHTRYPGKVPEIEFPPIPAYTIPMGALIPETIDGLIVCEKGISVTNIVNGTTRLQPVVLLTGQAAGVMAAMVAILPRTKKTEIRQLGVRWVQEKLVKAKTYLLPFTDVKPDHPYWEQIQKIGVTGILRGTGKAEGWGNKMFFYPDSTIVIRELEANIKDYLPAYEEVHAGSLIRDSLLTISSAFHIMERLYRIVNRTYTRYPSVIGDIFNTGDFNTIWNNIGLKEYQPNRLIKRYELAALLDSLLDPFLIRGKLITLTGK